jgi:hypothetical protein
MGKRMPVLGAFVATARSWTYSLPDPSSGLEVIDTGTVRHNPSRPSMRTSTCVPDLKTAAARLIA